METLFAKLASVAESNRLAAEAEWKAVVVKLANGSATEKEVTGALKSNPSRSLDDLKSAVKTRRRIDELQTEIGTQPAVHSRWLAAEQAFADFCLRRQEHFREEGTEYIRLNGELLEARSLVESIKTASIELANLIDVPVEMTID